MKTQTKFLTRTLLGFVTLFLVSGCLHAETSQSNSVSIISVTPASPAKLRTNEMIIVKVRYSTTNANPVLICVDAYTKGTRADCFSSGGASPAYTQKTGEAMNYFSVLHVPIDVDEVRVEMIEFKGNVPGIVENAVGGLAAERTSSAVKATNQNHQTHEETKPQFAGGSQHQIV